MDGEGEDGMGSQLVVVGRWKLRSFWAKKVEEEMGYGKEQGYGIWKGIGMWNMVWNRDMGYGKEQGCEIRHKTGY